MIKHIKAPKYSTVGPETAIKPQRDEARRAASALLGVPWSPTAEGSDFWGDVYNRLLQISKDGILKD